MTDQTADTDVEKAIDDYVAKWKASADECILKQVRINLELAKSIEQQLKEIQSVQRADKQ